MSEEEQEVLKTFKNGLGLTSAEREILANYIDKLQKENEELSESNFHFLEINQKLIEEKPIIKELTGKELNLLEKIDKLKKDNEEFQKANKMLNDYILSFQVDYVSKDKIRDKIKELEVKFKKHEGEGLSGFIDKLDVGTRIDVLRELLGE